MSIIAVCKSIFICVAVFIGRADLHVALPFYAVRSANNHYTVITFIFNIFVCNCKAHIFIVVIFKIICFNITVIIFFERVFKVFRNTCPRIFIIFSIYAFAPAAPVNLQSNPKIPSLSQNPYNIPASSLMSRL